MYKLMVQIIPILGFYVYSQVIDEKTKTEKFESLPKITQLG